jgi:calcineurin-like phosphoesterase family protein
MNEGIITSWNKTVSKKDTIYILGDVSFGNLEDTKQIVSKLNRYKLICIRGNHDEKFSTKDLLYIGFDEVRDTLVINSQGNKWILSHYPYSSSFKFFYHKLIQKILHKNNESNYYKLYLPYKGYTLIHGHHHSGSDSFDQINVAWDVNKRLISEPEIVARIEKVKLTGIKRLLRILKMIFF